ncbi:putative structural/gag protein [Fusarium virguliforme dsRNA mycovirus 2]|uniref:Putative structural/gag protein n=1 Tax=Fusarium virguliforme dsRNA mycovirus 2 TaxID=1141582 RepID=H6UNM9_9VIRU|nr:putative structural/gag protein [Fusarium virguliforme dsRNA mycovirus 2]
MSSSNIFDNTTSISESVYISQRRAALVTQGLTKAQVKQLYKSERLATPVFPPYIDVPSQPDTLTCSFLCPCLEGQTCKGAHPGGPLPAIPCDWNDDVVAILKDCCYLLGFPVSARPHAFEYLARRPLVSDIKRYAALTDPQGLNRRNVPVLLSNKVGLPEYHVPYHIIPAPHSDPLPRGPAEILFWHLLDILPVGAQLGSDSEGSLNAKSAYSPAPIEALGGVRVVPTNIPAMQLAPGYARHWSPDLWAPQVLEDPIQWTPYLRGNDNAVVRTSDFVYHYPDELDNPRLPKTFSAHLQSNWFQASEPSPDTVVQCQYNRRFKPDIVARSVLEEFSSIGLVMEGANNFDTLKDADSVASFSRALGSRGQRLVPGWEAAIVPRWQRFRDLATRSSTARSYQEFAFRAVSRYICAETVGDFITRVPGYRRHVANTATDIQIIHINADSIIPPPPAPGAPPAPPIWGEQQLWDPNMTQAMLEGRAQLIDGEGFSREELAAVVGCLAPSTYENVPQLIFEEDVIEEGQEEFAQHYMPYVTRQTFPNVTRHIIVHHGSAPIPPLADQQFIAAHAFDFPSAGILSTVLRSYAARHALEDVILAAFDASIYRCVGYPFAAALGADRHKHSNVHVDSSGSAALYMPPNITIRGYFDVFFSPAPNSSNLENLLAMSGKHLLHTGTLVNHCRATSLAWAGKSASILGVTWQQMGAPVNQFVRNHRDKWLRHYYGELNIWSALHANAMAYQYGFAPSPHTRRTESGSVVDWWRAYTPPTLTNHYLELWAMQTIPVFQLLPYYDPREETSHVDWAAGTPDQTASLLTFSREKKIRLAPEMENRPGYHWLGDGGAEYNAQFYAAQGSNGQFSYEGAHPKSTVVFWEGQYARSFPAAPNAGNYISMTDNVLGLPFSDFILPGSLASYRLTDDRNLNWGIKERTGVELTPSEVRRWWSASKGLPHQSLMVNYISPFSEHYEVDALSNYTVTIWEKDSHFAGITFSDITRQLSDAKFDPRSFVRDQTPFQLHFDSAPKAFEQNRSSRVLRRTSRVVNRGADLAASINNRLAHRVKQSGLIEYQSKNPSFEDELPPMRSKVATANSNGIMIEENDGQPVDNSARLAYVNEMQARLDQARDELTGNWQQEAAMRRAARRAPAHEHTKSSLYIPATGTARKARAEKRRSVSEAVVPTSRQVTGAFNYSGPLQDTTEPVVPNDAAAVETQESARQNADHLFMTGALPARQTPLGRTPTPKRQRSPSNTRNGGRPDILAQTSDSEQEMDVYPERTSSDETPKVQRGERTVQQVTLSDQHTRVRNTLPDGAVDLSDVVPTGNAATDMDQYLDAFSQTLRNADAQVTSPKN